MPAGSVQRGIVAALAALMLVAGGVARADYKRSYTDGVEAAGKGQWGTVREKMNAALAEESTPAAKARIYGTRFEPYVPKYYLGLAAYRQGDCTGALANWNDGPTKAIVQGIPALSGVASAGVRDCESKSVAVVPTPTPQPTITPKPTPTPLPTVTPKPSPTPPPPPSPTPKPSPSPSPPPVAAPVALVNAVEALLTGKYTQAATLDMSQFGDPRARWHALVIRAAAKYTLSQLDGDASGTQLAAVQADIRAAKAIDGARQPDASVFSPRFRTLYQQTR